MLDFGALPPEVNSTRMYAGAGSGPMMAAASAWDALAVQLESVSRGYEATISGLLGDGWSGTASNAMADAAAPYVAWMTTAGAKAEEAASRARAAAAAYETAFAATVPPALVTANRTQLTNLVATNIFGQNTTQIAATEASYAEMWAQDAGAMYGYAASSSTAAMLTPFSEPPQTTNLAGQSNQATAVAHAMANSTATRSQATLSQFMSAVPQQLQGLGSGASGVSTSASALAAASPILNGFSAFNTLTGPLSLGAGLSRTFTSAGSFATGALRAQIQAAGDLPVAATQGVTVGAKSLASDAVRSAVLANMGRAAPIGGLSVPQSWASATPVASAVEEPLWMSEMDLGSVASLEETAATGTAAGAPVAGVGPMAGMLARHSVSSVLKVAPRRFKMPRPSIGG